MSLEDTRKFLAQYYTEKLETFGATPQGVDYGKPEAQTIRFEQLVKVIDPSQRFSVVDVGCGYGALFDFLQGKGWQFDYYGVDLIEKMVIAGREAHARFPNARFTTQSSEVPKVDFAIAGAIFNNIKTDTPLDEWGSMVRDTLRNLDGMCTKGFSFNMLTQYSDADRMAQRPDLYFADPLAIFDFCKRNLSRNVALLHDYGVYDFTILVRKNV